MVQSSLTAWLRKPAAVTEPAVVANQQPRAEATPPTPPSPSVQEEARDDQSETTVENKQDTRELGVGPARPPLPPNVHIRACTKADIPALKRLTSLLLPIPYPDSFYREILEDSLTNNITLIASWHDDPSTTNQEKGRLVGAIRCRLFAHPHGTPAIAHEKPMLYLSTLVLLSPYRSHGIAAQMLRLLIVRAVEQYGIGSVGAHVWEANQEGLEWYAKRGFRVVGTEESYYRRLKPSGAVVMRREIGVADLLGG
ncbi:hypothetical protein LTR56_003281 [Elasticomyces elasticus]|nr:hypothetical protein LTR22_011845 [Elasticomyces elasticus]KAK3656149.1 hypothetical protein LTR56_003281 [Elasticomyces elasticus]KAK4912434.1 hypothetical protein LTR49_019151 [Elasticomyces elasticus]KAK5751675.1 hypothetical protein LTS12_018287 [Elasticomyces elasticus]